jgi:hypothetical protein
VLSGTAPYAAWEAELTAYARWRSGSRDLSVVFGLGTETGWTETVRLARPASRDPRVAFTGAELELEHLLAHYRHGWREAVLAFHAWSQPGEPVSLPWPPWDQVSLPAAVVRQAVGEAIPALSLPPAAETWSVRHRTAAAWMVAAWADGLHRALEVAERPGMAERLPLPPAPASRSAPPPRPLSAPAKGARIERRQAWEGALYRLATPQEPAPEGLREVLGERAAEGLEGLLRLGPDDLQALVSGVLDVVGSLRQRNAVPPGPEQHPRWLRRDWGRWRRAPALRAALDHLARSPSSVAVAMATSAGRMHASLPSTNGAPTAATVALRRTTTGPSPAAGGDEAGRGERAQDGPQDRHPAEDWAPPPAAALPDAGPAAPGGEGGQREGSERDGGPAGGQAGGGSGPGALGALKVVAPSSEDRAAYWQLRGALAPEIERLIERLQAAGDRYYEATPRRFQRTGRVDRNRLPAAMAGREAVFARFVHRPAPANALCLLLDCSASMAPYAEQLREASILIESAATAVGARVSAFTFGAAWERLEPPAEGAPLVALGRELRPHGPARRRRRAPRPPARRPGVGPGGGHRAGAPHAGAADRRRAHAG